MNLDLKVINEIIEQNSFIKNFIKELSKTIENYKTQKELKGENMDNIKLTQKEDLEYYRKKWDFLEKYFKKELLDLSKGEIFIVTNKYENDHEYNRYKVTQYKNNKECKYIAFKKDLPPNVQLGDIVRKNNGKYFYDDQATQYVKKTINQIKQEIIDNRN